MPTATMEKKMVSKTLPKSDLGANGFAVIETGGKQYKVAEGEIIKIEKLKGKFKEGSEVVFDKVLLKENGEGAPLHLGAPYLLGTKVTGMITEIGRNKKVVVIHYKQKSRYFKKAGHRQPYFKVKIEKIS